MPSLDIPVNLLVQSLSIPVGLITVEACFCLLRLRERFLPEVLSSKAMSSHFVVDVNNPCAHVATVTRGDSPTRPSQTRRPPGT